MNVSLSPFSTPLRVVDEAAFKSGWMKMYRMVPSIKKVLPLVFITSGIPNSYFRLGYDFSPGLWSLGLGLLVL